MYYTAENYITQDDEVIRQNSRITLIPYPVKLIYTSYIVKVSSSFWENSCVVEGVFC